MDDSLTEKIRAVLSDPAAAEKIASIAGSLSGGGQSAPAAEAGAFQEAGAFHEASKKPPLPASLPRDPRLDLLRALRPLVAEEKRGRLDDLVQIATIASLLGSFNKRGR